MKILKNIFKTSLVFGLLTTSFSDLNARGFNDIRDSMNNLKTNISNKIEQDGLYRQYNKFKKEYEKLSKTAQKLDIKDLDKIGILYSKIDNLKDQITTFSYDLNDQDKIKEKSNLLLQKIKYLTKNNKALKSYYSKYNAQMQIFEADQNKYKNINDVLTEMKNVQNKVSKIYNQVMNNKNNKNICNVDTSDFENRITLLMQTFTNMHPSQNDDTYMQNIYNNVIQMCNSINDNIIERSKDKIDQDRADNQLLCEANSSSSDDERYYAKLPNFERNAIDNVKLFYGQNVTPEDILKFLNEDDNEDAHKYTLDEVNQMIDGIKSVDEEIEQEDREELKRELGLL